MRRLLVLLAFVLLALPAQAGAGTVFLIDGRGWGHGVGMSQYGARGYAEAGWGYQRILKHYYRGTAVKLVPARQVRVLLAEGRAAVKISSSKPFKLVDARGKVRKLKPGTQNVAAAKLARLRSPLRFVPGAAPLRLGADAYRGSLLVHRRGAKLVVVNRLPLDRYLRGVVPWEMPEDWHPEALRAQAVVARSYALATLKPGTLFDLYADTRSQVYGGVQAEEASTNRAIGSTAGKALLWNGRVATTFYHSTSGGRTVSVGEAWPRATPVPYLVSVADPHDTLSKHHRWGPVLLTPAQVAAKLGVPGAPRPRRRARALGAGDVGAAEGGALGADDALAGLPPCARPSLDLVQRPRAQPRSAARAGAREPPVKLRGFVRGLGRVRLEQQVNGGTWTTVRPVRTRPDGRFTITVSPRRTTSYRLATPKAAGGAVTVKLR